MDKITETNESGGTGTKSQKTVPGWARVLILIVPYILVVGLFEVLGSLVAGFRLREMGSTMGTPNQMLIMQFFNFVGTALVLFLMMRVVDREKFIQMGFQWQGRSIDIIFGILAGLILIFIGFMLLYLMGNMKILGISLDVRNLMILILIFLLVAFAEEMLMRGYVLKNLMLSMNKFVALVLSSLMFSAMHFFNPDFSLFSFIGIFVAGIALGATYIYTKNLWFPIAFHFSWNLFQSLVGFNVSGLDAYSIVEASPQGAERLSGGSFGFEGSVFSVLFEIIMIAMIFMHFKRIGTKKSA